LGFDEEEGGDEERVRREVVRNVRRWKGNDFGSEEWRFRWNVWVYVDITFGLSDYQ